MGAFQGEWHIDLHISSTTCSFCSVFCNVLYLLKGLYNTRNHSVWCSGWSDTAYGFSKSRVHAAADKAWAPQLATMNLICYGYIWEPNLTVANEGAHTLGKFKKHPHSGSQIDPSDMICNFFVFTNSRVHTCMPYDSSYGNE